MLDGVSKSRKFFLMLAIVMVGLMIGNVVSEKDADSYVVLGLWVIILGINIADVVRQRRRYRLAAAFAVLTAMGKKKGL
jgi:hypothetical protein